MNTHAKYDRRDVTLWCRRRDPSRSILVRTGTAAAVPFVGDRIPRAFVTCYDVFRYQTHFSADCPSLPAWGLFLALSVAGYAGGPRMLMGASLGPGRAP